MGDIEGPLPLDFRRENSGWIGGLFGGRKPVQARRCEGHMATFSCTSREAIPMNPASNRRWFQFSLRTLLLWGVPLCAFSAAVLARDGSLVIKSATIALIAGLWVVLLRKDIRNRQKAAELPATQF